VRFLGTTIHHKDLVGVARAAAESDTWDIIMPQYHPQLRKELDPILAKAQKRGIGVLAMKTMINIDRRALAQQEAALRTAVAGNVDSVIRSIDNLDTLKRYLAAALQPAERADYDRLDEAVAFAQGKFCAACGACADCPRGVEIAEILKCKDYYAVQMDDLAFARSAYRCLLPHHQPPNCEDCGRCERVCPQQLPVRQMLYKAHGMLA
jgi:predicted aldo/keto reductase-like oxidoreductase